MSDILQIKRDGVTVHSVRISTDTQLVYQLMGEHKVSGSWVSPTPLTLILGDYVEVGIEKFYLNTLPQVVRGNNFTYRYTGTWESELYKLFNKIMMDEGAVDFTYFGTPSEYIQLILDNMNAIDTGWTMAVDADLNPISIAFNGESCRQALARICDEFKLEFRLVQKQIIVKHDVGFASLYQLEYGRSKGLYSLTRDSVVEKGVVTRLFAFGAAKNLAFDYREGSKRLVFETGAPLVRYIEANVNLYGIKEGSVTFDDIFPQRTGSVTSTASKNVITDGAIDFDINAYRLSSDTWKIVFKTGSLAGVEFEINSYNHATKTISFLDRVEANEGTFPRLPSFIPTIGDTYTLVDIKMPPEYIAAAEAALLAAATTHLDTVKNPRVTYTLEIDEKFIRTNGVEIGCGMKVRVKDTQLGLDELIRIYSIQYPIVNPSMITAQIADTIPVTFVERIIKDVAKGKIETVTIDRTQAEQYRDSVKRFNELKNSIFDPEGNYFKDGLIRPGSVETLSLAVGAQSQNFGLAGVEIEANYGGDANSIRISGGELIHFEIEIEGLGYVWDMDPAIINALVPANKYYVYARCNKFALTGTWVISTEPITAESEAGFYHFWLGILYPVGENLLRYFMFTKGMTYIVGDTITTGKIQDLSGINFFDLTQGVFNLGDETNGMDWGVTNEGKLTIRGAIITNAIFAIDGVIENLRVSSLKTAESGKRLEILADDGGDPATPLHNLKFYDADGNLAVTLDSGVDEGSGFTAKAGLKIQEFGSDRTVLMTQNGMMSEGSYMGSGSLPTNQHLGSIIGVLKDKFFTAFGIRAGVIGYDATDPAVNNASYGGWFNTLFAGGLNVGTKQITANYTATLDDTLLSCYNTSPIAVNLPANPRVGKVIMVRTNFNVATQVNGNGKSIWVKGAVASIAVAGTSYSRHGRNHLLIFDGTYWLYNALPAVGGD